MALLKILAKHDFFEMLPNLENTTLKNTTQVFWNNNVDKIINLIVEYQKQDTWYMKKLVEMKFQNLVKQFCSSAATEKNSTILYYSTQDLNYSISYSIKAKHMDFIIIHQGAKYGLLSFCVEVGYKFGLKKLLETGATLENLNLNKSIKVQKSRNIPKETIGEIVKILFDFGYTFTSSEAAFIFRNGGFNDANLLKIYLNHGLNIFEKFDSPMGKNKSMADASYYFGGQIEKVIHKIRMEKKADKKKTISDDLEGFNTTKKRKKKKRKLFPKIRRGKTLLDNQDLDNQDLVV